MIPGKGPPRIEVGLAPRHEPIHEGRGAALAAQQTARPVRLAPEKRAEVDETITEGAAAYDIDTLHHHHTECPTT